MVPQAMGLHFNEACMMDVDDAAALIPSLLADDDLLLMPTPGAQVRQPGCSRLNCTPFSLHQGVLEVQGRSRCGARPMGRDLRAKRQQPSGRARGSARGLAAAQEYSHASRSPFGKGKTLGASRCSLGGLQKSI